ncbi:MAG: hypothetical protein J6X43_05025 [Bacteroidales bacterium]|nr:hypothetical protein [Bacteroidales bacterium]
MTHEQAVKLLFGNKKQKGGLFDSKYQTFWYFRKDFRITTMLSFHPLTISDREAVQVVSLKAERRNCNYTFANLVGWQFWFHTEVCVWKDAVVLRFNFEGKRAYMVCVEGDLQPELLTALYKDSGENLMLIGLEDSQLQTVNTFNT